MICFLLLLFLLIKFELSNQSVVKLYPGDFEEIILFSDDAWLVSIQESGKHAETIEKEYRGIFRVAWMNKRDFMKNQKIKLDASTLCLVYPYGSEEQKLKKYKTSNSVKEAVGLVLQSIPDTTVHLRNIEGQNEMLRGFFQEAYATTPTRFALIYFTDSTDVPVKIKVLALKYSNLFSFGVINNPAPHTLAAYSIHKLPHFTALVVDRLEKHKQPRIKKIPFTEETQGPLKYSLLVRFLYLLHKYHYAELPYANINKVDVDLDSIFFDDLDRFSEEYLKHQLNEQAKKTEL